MSDLEGRRRRAEEIVSNMPPSSPLVMTRGSLRRAMGRLITFNLDAHHSPGGEQDPERTDEELLFALDNVARAVGRYVRLQRRDMALDGTFHNLHDPAMLSCEFLYYHEGRVSALEYSPEDVVLKGMGFKNEGNVRRKIYVFEEQYRPAWRSMPQGLDALVAKYHLWRAGVRGPDSVIPSDTR